MDFSVFNPVVWIVFIGFCVVTWLAVKAFHAMHPDYPGYQQEENEDSKRIRMEVTV
jgi:hypothetical protein